MPTFKTEMLIRDKSLKFLQSEGIEVDHAQVSDVDMPQVLRTRLLETATDAALQERPLELLQEMADIYEVMVVLAVQNGLSEEKLQEKIKERREELGSFSEGLFSYSVTVPEGHNAEPYYREHPEKFPEVK
ncbi:MAG: hypothetical protein OXR68_03820 [Alphaproteobacteria bacterium]|nr:hypothetical protein [Alphaproteobacteria bacterium]MDD9919733.1 hypothetical protein [Alphaproteobacteria bacterium]